MPECCAASSELPGGSGRPPVAAAAGHCTDRKVGRPPDWPGMLAPFILRMCAASATTQYGALV